MRTIKTLLGIFLLSVLSFPALAARDGTGVMTVPYPDFQSGAIITDTEIDANNADIVSELTNSIPRDGQAAPTADIPWGTNKLTGLKSGTAATDAANLGQVQAQAYIWGGTAGGSKNALTLTPTPPITAYAAGQSFVFIAGSTKSDDAATVAVSGLATKAIQNNGAALSATVNIEAGKLYRVTYDGTQFQLSKQFSPDGVFAPLASPTFTGTPTLPTGTIATTQSAGDKTTAVATTAFVNDTILSLKDGTTATTQAAADSSTKVATTGFVNGTALALTDGTTAATQTVNDSSTKVATTAFVNPANTLGATETTTKLGGGLIIKSGNFTSSGGTGTVTFGAAFPTACVSAIIQPYPNSARYANATSRSASAFNWVVSASVTDQPFTWIAIGY